MDFREVLVRPVGRAEEERYKALMHEHHYLGRLPKISETLWYVALWRDHGWLFHLFRRRMEVRGARPVDRMESAPSI